MLFNISEIYIQLFYFHALSTDLHRQLLASIETVRQLTLTNISMTATVHSLENANLHLRADLHSYRPDPNYDRDLQHLFPSSPEPESKRRRTSGLDETSDPDE